MYTKMQLIEELKNEIESIRIKMINKEMDAVKALSLEISILNSIVRLQQTMLNDESEAA